MADQIAPTDTTAQARDANRTLNTPHIVGLIVGAATPLAVLVGTIPLGLALGGPSLGLTFLAAGLVVLLFIVGYVKMAQRISRPGAFYNYISRGLGRPIGVGAAMIAALAYPLGLIGAFAINAVLIQGMIQQLFGVTIAWQILLLISVAVVGTLSYLGIDLSAGIVFIIVIIEVTVVTILIISIIVSKGAGAFPIEALSPHVLTVGQVSVAFIFAFLCYQGFEAGAMYSPEAKNPSRTVPRALYAAVIVVTATFFLATWALTSTTGIEGMQAKVAEIGIGGFVFATVSDYLGPFGLFIFSVGTLMSILAIEISIVNFMSRYLRTLAAEDLLPRYLARSNRFRSPGAAIITLLALALVVIFGASLIGLDPLTQVSSVAFGIGALCSTVLMLTASIAVIAYFQRLPRSERNLWTTLIAPAIASVLLLGALIVQITGFSYITGSQEGWTGFLPWVVLIVLVSGIGFGVWIRRFRPRTYQDLAAGDSAEEAAALREIRVQAHAEEKAARRS
ncbi:MAG TPA: APC family permease [Pseudolysinimonas sp.]|nr:APC family permease [Pseudolysinimonas sp.]